MRFTQGIASERLATLLSGILWLDISEAARVNMREAARHPFATPTSPIRARLLPGTAREPDATGVRAGKSNWWLERVPIKWHHLIDKDSFKIKELERVLIEKAE